MDGSNIEHSDSDSGESWSLVDHIPAYGDEVPEFPETTPVTDHDVAEVNVDKDEDTDGISIITDSDPESSMPFETSYTKSINDNKITPDYVTINPTSTPINSDDLNEEIRSHDDLLGDSSVKNKTYVHRRNKRLSTVLNIIVLGSVITAAGVAIGHMWGAKNDCTINTTPSVNKILSNLYKLQEENAYLRSKLKELTLMNNIQYQQRKSGTEKQNKCRKVFEESLNKIVDKPTKCVDNGDVPKLMDNYITETKHEKEFLQDLDKLKHVYKQNKSWLDDEISKRMNYEEQIIKRRRNALSSFNKDSTQSKGDNLDIILETISEQPITGASIPEVAAEPIVAVVSKDNYEQAVTDRKISYADSLKSEQKIKKVEKRESIIVSENRSKEHNKKVNYKNLEPLPSEEEFKKDDRYVGPKPKPEGKKNDRQKIHKKQKRKNKYEQWEMKGGYLKDYDEFSITSHENEYILKNTDKNYLAKDYERHNYLQQFLAEEAKPETGDNKINMKYIKEKPAKGNSKNKEKDIPWFEKRAVLRNEARKKLEHELFGETSPNNAGWYFRRMQRREQCRAKGDNSTYKKLLKRNMNFKTKH